MSKSGLIYKEYGLPRDRVKHTCMINPGVSIEVYKYSDNLLIHCNLFKIGDLANAGFPPAYHSLKKEDRKEIDLYLKSPEFDGCYYANIQSITDITIILKYSQLPFKKERRIPWDEFIWRNSEFRLIIS